MFGKKSINSIYLKWLKEERDYIYGKGLSKEYSALGVSWNSTFGYMLDDGRRLMKILYSQNDHNLAMQYAEKIMSGINQLAEIDVDQNDVYDYEARASSRMLYLYVNILSGRSVSSSTVISCVRKSMIDMKIFRKKIDESESLDFYENAILQEAILALLIGDKDTFFDVVKNEGKEFKCYPQVRPFLENIVTAEADHFKELNKQFKHILYDSALPQVPSGLSLFLQPFKPLAVVTMTLVKLLYVNRSVVSLDKVKGDDIITEILKTK